MKIKRINKRYGYYEVTVGCCVLKKFPYRNKEIKSVQKEAEEYCKLPITQHEKATINLFKEKLRLKDAAFWEGLGSGIYGESPYKDYGRGLD